MRKAIESFLRPTGSTIAATFAVAIFLVANEGLAVQAWPRASLSLRICHVVFAPAGALREMMLSTLPDDARSSWSGPLSFMLDMLTYYLLGCLMVNILRRNLADKAER